MKKRFNYLVDKLKKADDWFENCSIHDPYFLEACDKYQELLEKKTKLSLEITGITKKEFNDGFEHVE